MKMDWNLKDAKFTKDKGKVFSCFACGGGSTMGYKLAGFDVIGHNDIDRNMVDVYRANHKPKYSFLESITTFSKRKDLPKELYELDILDGSPPCSSFSMAGNREKDWGKNKKFTEGQEFQVLDTLFFDFIYLAKELQPKVVVAENVKGILMGRAKDYVIRIYKELEEAGYVCQHFLLNSSKMNVPQKRERVFFIAVRKDLATQISYNADLFSFVPKIKLSFNNKEITFRDIEEKNGTGIRKEYKSIKEMWERTKPGYGMIRNSGKSAISHYKIDPNKVLPTIIAHTGGSGGYHYSTFRSMSKIEFIRAGTFPLDYNFLKIDPQYLIGMSVPPFMACLLAEQIFEQILKKVR